MLTGLSTWTTPLVDSHAVGNRSVTLDTAASPSDISCHSPGVRLLTPSSAAPNVGLLSSVLAPRPVRDGLLGAVAHDDDVDDVARLVGPDGLAELLGPVDGDAVDAERRRRRRWMPASSAGPLACTAPTSAPGVSTNSPRIEYTVNSSTMAISRCISEPAEMTSMRRG